MAVVCELTAETYTHALQSSKLLEVRVLRHAKLIRDIPTSLYLQRNGITGGTPLAWPIRSIANAEHGVHAGRSHVETFHWQNRKVRHELTIQNRTKNFKVASIYRVIFLQNLLCFYRKLIIFIFVNFVTSMLHRFNERDSLLIVKSLSVEMKANWV